MSRAFGATHGAGTSDIVRTSLTTHSTKSSTSLWTYRNGDGGASVGWMYGKTTTDAEWFFNDGLGGTTYQFNRQWTGTLGAWTFTRPGPTAWHHILIVYDASVDANHPVVYLNGEIVTVTRISAPSGSPATTTSGYDIGNRGVDSARNWDGRLHHFTRWHDCLLTQGEARALAVRRVHPFNIRRDKIVLFDPLGEQPVANGRHTVSRVGTRPSFGPNTLDFLEPDLALLAAQAHTTAAAGAFTRIVGTRFALAGPGGLAA